MSDAPITPARARRRSAVLRAADRLFTQHGFDKTTVADIAAGAQIGVGSVYLEFDSKETVAAALARVSHTKVFEAMLLAVAAEDSFAKRLLAFFEARATHFWELASVGPHAIDLMLPTTCAGVTVERERFESAEAQLLIGLLESGHEAGELRVEEAREAAQVLMRIYATYAPPRLYEHDPAESRRMLAATHDLVIHGLLRRA